MKLRSLLFGLFLCASAASAADVITRTDGTTIDAKVEEITETTIRYRKATNPTGPVYTIPLASVVKIVYDNGDTDTFNTPAEAPSTSTTPTDEELMRYSETLAPTPNAAGAMSDAELLRYMNKNTMTPQQLYAKANKYKRIGWIGGGCLFAVGAIVGTVTLWYADSDILTPQYEWQLFGLAAVTVLPTAGIAMCLAYNIRANQLRRQAQEMEFYSSSIIEDEIFRFGDKSLTAGVSIMGNQMTRTQGYGLSLKLNF